MSEQLQDERRGVRFSGYLAKPTSSGPWPGVIVIHELFGLTPDIRGITDRIAEHGYLSLAVDLFSRGTARCLVSNLRELVSGRPGRAIDQIEAARAVLADRDDCTGKVGVIGFCMGGGFAILAAGRHDFDAAAPNYGVLPKDADRALRGGCPMVASYGAKDRGLRGTAGRLEETLTRLAVEHDVKEYTDSGHSFMTPHTGTWSFVTRLPGMGGTSADADDAWRRVFAFFDHHLEKTASA